MMTDQNTLSGECHCGNISFQLKTQKDASELVPRTCQCSLCLKHGASYISDPKGTLRVHYSQKEQVSFYRFGHATADFIICQKCGVLTMAICELNGKKHAVLNIKPMKNYSFSDAPIQTDFEAETVEGRLTRRAQNWVSTVQISSTPLQD